MISELEKLQTILDIRIQVNNAKLALLLGKTDSAVDILDLLVKELNHIEENTIEINKLRKREK